MTRHHAPEGPMNRFLVLAAAITLTCAMPRSLPAQEKPAKRGPVTLTAEALKIHHDALLIDGHNDLPWQYRKGKDFSFQRIDIARPQPTLHTDIERLKKGGVGAQFWSAYVDADTA